MRPQAAGTLLKKEGIRVRIVNIVGVSIKPDPRFRPTITFYPQTLWS